MNNKKNNKGKNVRTVNKSRKRKNLNIFVIHKMKWVFILGLIVILGGIFSYGIIFFYMKLTRQYDPLTMLAMIPLMIIVVTLGIYISLSAIEKKLKPLLQGLQKIADGDLSVRLDLKKADEFEIFYKNFNIMATELENSKAQMQNFINEFTHEFKTPITSISGFADVLYETGKDIESEERLEYLKIIAMQSHRLSNLSQNTLLLSKIEATQIVTDKENFSLSEQIKKCVILLMPQIEKKDITINIEDDFDFNYYGNEELMEQIWINLLNNAIKFTDKYGEIYIYASKSNDILSINIKDTGVGMDASTISHIFDRYYQNDNTNMIKGNGIGLSIVKRIVELCNGTIDVISEPNVGSTFKVNLPNY